MEPVRVPSVDPPAPRFQQISSVYSCYVGKENRVTGEKHEYRPVEDCAPSDPTLTQYDSAHVATYVRLLDAEASGADWHEVARLVLDRDPVTDEAAARRCWESHLSRARWMTQSGYRQLMPDSGPH